MRTQTKVVIAMFLAVMLAATVAAAANKDETLSGVVSDSMCGASHMAKDKTDAECTRMCVKDGSKYALVVGNKVYNLRGMRLNWTNSLARRLLSRVKSVAPM